VKDNLAGISLDQSEGVLRRITAEEFTTSCQRLYEHCQKCIEISGGYVEKSLQ
jgi:hypothetical protein